MPGANCSIACCNVSRNKPGVAIFKVPVGDDEYSTNWRNKLVTIIKTNREVDAPFRQQIEKRKLHICERHYTEDCLNHHPSKTTLVPGSIPTLCLPEKSIPPTITKPRDSADIIAKKRSQVSSSTVTSPPPSFYKSYEQFIQRVQQLKLPDSWQIFVQNNNVKVVKQDGIHVLPHYEIFIGPELQFTVKVFMWKLPDDHEIYVKNKRTVRNITLTNLIVCLGISNVAVAKSGIFKKHCIPKLSNSDMDTDDNVPIIQTEFNRSCEVLCVS